MKNNILKTGLVSLALIMSSGVFSAPVPWGYVGVEGPEFWGDLMNNDGQLSVLGVFIKPDHDAKENEALATILANAPTTIATNTLAVKIDLKDILPAEEIESFWKYNGSLTTPPCSEGVKWYIAQKHIHVSVEQIEEMAALVHHNNYRPTQNLNGRAVESTNNENLITPSHKKINIFTLRFIH